MPRTLTPSAARGGTYDERGYGEKTQARQLCRLRDSRPGQQHRLCRCRGVSARVLFRRARRGLRRGDFRRMAHRRHGDNGDRAHLGCDQRPDNGLARAEGETDQMGQIPPLSAFRRHTARAFRGADVRAYTRHVARGVHSFCIFHLHCLRYDIYRRFSALRLACDGHDAQRERAEQAFRRAVDRRRHRRRARRHLVPSAGLFFRLQRGGREVRRRAGRRKAGDLHGGHRGHHDSELLGRIRVHKRELRLSACRSADKPEKGVEIACEKQAFRHHEPCRNAAHSVVDVHQFHQRLPRQRLLPQAAAHDFRHHCDLRAHGDHDPVHGEDNKEDRQERDVRLRAYPFRCGDSGHERVAHPEPVGVSGVLFPAGERRGILHA